MKTHKKGGQPKVNSKERPNKRQGDPRFKRQSIQATRDHERGWFATIDEIPGAFGEARTLPGALRELASVLEDERLWHGNVDKRVEKMVSSEEAGSLNG